MYTRFFFVKAMPAIGRTIQINRKTGSAKILPVAIRLSWIISGGKKDKIIAKSNPICRKLKIKVSIQLPSVVARKIEASPERISRKNSKIKAAIKTISLTGTYSKILADIFVPDANLSRFHGKNIAMAADI